MKKVLKHAARFQVTLIISARLSVYLYLLYFKQVFRATWKRDKDELDCNFFHSRFDSVKRSRTQAE